MDGYRQEHAIPSLLVNMALTPHPKSPWTTASRSWLETQAFLGSSSRTDWLSRSGKDMKMWVTIRGKRLELNFNLMVLSRRSLLCLSRTQRWWIVLLSGDAHLWPGVSAVGNIDWTPEHNTPERMWEGALYTGMDSDVLWMAIAASHTVVALANSGPTTEVRSLMRTPKTKDSQPTTGTFSCPAHLLPGADACDLIFRRLSLTGGRARSQKGRSALMTPDSSDDDGDCEPIDNQASYDITAHLSRVDCVRTLILR